jgi:hypothetical protein
MIDFRGIADAKPRAACIRMPRPAQRVTNNIGELLRAATVGRSIECVELFRRSTLVRRRGVVGVVAVEGHIPASGAIPACSADHNCWCAAALPAASRRLSPVRSA